VLRIVTLANHMVNSDAVFGVLEGTVNHLVFTLIGLHYPAAFLAVLGFSLRIDIVFLIMVFEEVPQEIVTVSLVFFADSIVTQRNVRLTAVGVVRDGALDLVATAAAGGVGAANFFVLIFVVAKTQLAESPFTLVARCQFFA